MPVVEDVAFAEMLRHSLISIGISNHSRGSNFPALVDKPRKVTVERDGAAIADPRRPNPHYVASDDTPADASAVRSLLDVQFDLGTGQQPMVRLDQRAARGHINQTRAMSRMHARRPYAVFLEGLHPAEATSIL
jgi:hypothetical protein